MEENNDLKNSITTQKEEEITPWNYEVLDEDQDKFKCEDEFLGSSSKSDILYCMKLCQNTKSCKFSSYSEDKNQCLLFNTCYKFNKNESSYSSSKVKCDLPSGGAYSPVLFLPLGFKVDVILKRTEITFLNLQILWATSTLQSTPHS